MLFNFSSLRLLWLKASSIFSFALSLLSLAFRVGVGFGFGLCFCLSVSSASGEILELQSKVIEVFNQNQDAIIRVKAAFRQDPVEGKPSQINVKLGTGFLISQEGHALVSASRAMGADRIEVEFKGISYPAEAIGHDPQTNISLIKLLKLPKYFGIMRLRSDEVPSAVGTMILSIACPLDFAPSPTIGMVSGLDKRLGDRIFPTQYIRTTIPVDVGQGGCPIFDLEGQLVGMSISSIPYINGSYCVPAASLFRVKEDLMYSGKSERGWLGLEVKENASKSTKGNVHISKMNKGGPAENAGLKVGDQIISICGVRIEEISDLPSAIFKTRNNQLAPIKVIRGKKELDFSIKAEEAPENTASE